MALGLLGCMVFISDAIKLIESAFYFIMLLHVVYPK